MESKTIITGMGRSGTKWVADFLGVPHEPIDMGGFYLKLMSGRMSDEEHAEEVEMLLNGLPDVHVSSYWRMSIDDLKDHGVRVIGLVRHPQDVVASLYNRAAAYGPEMYPRYLFKTDEEFGDFMGMDYVRRLIWLWEKSNEILYDEADVIIRFEDLLENAKEAFKLCKMLGMEFDKQKWVKMRGKKINRTPFHKRKFDLEITDVEWLRMVMDEMCGKMMRKSGYEFKERKVRKRLALNIGCGIDYRELDGEYEWINIDANPEADRDDDIDLCEMDAFYNGRVHFIEARDVLEHIQYGLGECEPVWKRALTSWVRCLAVDGVIRIQTPDPYGLFRMLQMGEIDEVEYNRRVFSDGMSVYERHYQLMSRARLKRELIERGLRIEKSEMINGNAIVTARRVV